MGMDQSSSMFNVLYELDKLVEEGVLEWAIVSVWKPDKKSVRICGDFKQTVNRASKHDKYPTKSWRPFCNAERCASSISTDETGQEVEAVCGCEYAARTVPVYSIAFWHFISRFQRVMESILRDISGVVVYLDDILITAETKEEHLERLNEAYVWKRKNFCLRHHLWS